MDDLALAGDPGGNLTGYEAMAVLAGAWGTRRGDPAYAAAADLNGDGVVDDRDVGLLLGSFR